MGNNVFYRKRHWLQWITTSNEKCRVVAVAQGPIHIKFKNYHMDEEKEVTLANYTKPPYLLVALVGSCLKDGGKF